MREYTRDQPAAVRDIAAGAVSSLIAQVLHTVSLACSKHKPVLLQSISVPIDVVSQSLMLQGQQGHLTKYTARSLVKQIYDTDV